MEIKLITTNATTSGVGVGFRFLGNVEIKKGPTIFGTLTKPKQTVGFRFNNVETTVNSNDEGYFEVYRDSDELITQFSTGTNNNLLKTLNVSNLDTSQVTNMSNMFYACMGLTSLDLSNFDTSQVTNMSDMFGGCMGLTSLDVSNWNTSKVTNMSNMFNYCTSLNSFNLSNWDTSKVTNMSNMFYACMGLASLDVSKWNTSQVTNMSNMFNYCTGLASLDLSNFDTSQVTTMDGMFIGCESLRDIKINDETSANKLIAQIKEDLSKTATWNPETKIITISA